MMKYFILISFLISIVGCFIENESTRLLRENIMPKLVIEQDSIILKLEEELIDENTKRNYSILTNKMINKLRSSKSDFKVFFPFTDIDSVVLICLNKDNFPKATLGFENSCVLIELVNNPINFQWSECGTPVPEYRFVLYNKGSEKAELSVSCLGGFIECKPNNILCRYGGLTIDGKLKLSTLIKTALNE
jgi:hypothetical protein